MGGKFLYHTSCPKCGSRDNLAVYLNEDGSYSGFCFTPGCGYTFRTRSPEHLKQYAEVQTTRNLEDLIPFSYMEIPKRGIHKNIAEAFIYGIGEYKGEPVHVANYLDVAGNVVAQKIRTRNKEFRWLGNTKVFKLLFGQHLWLSGGGKKLVITEGEIDALSVAQATNMQIPVVSVPNGASGAAKSIKEHLDWVESFEKIILAFDNDNAGKKAIQDLVEILTPGKVYVVNFGQYKDANDVLMNAGEYALKQMIQQATLYTPEGIILGENITLDFLLQNNSMKSYELPFPQLMRMLRGLRKKELTLLTAGTGIGKSTFAREIAFHLAQKYPDMRIGYIALEDGVHKTAVGFIALYHNIPFGCLLEDRTLLTKEQWEEARQKVLPHFVFYNHFGSLQSQSLISKIKYMAQGLDCSFIFLDHISIVVSGLEIQDERKQIDVLMTRLRSIVEQTKVGMVVISHLRKYNSSNTAEEGRRITLDDLRGSGALKQLADNVIALEVEEKDIRRIRVLKNRLFGDIGEADTLFYDREIGRLKVYEFVDEF